MNQPSETTNYKNINHNLKIKFVQTCHAYLKREITLVIFVYEVILNHFKVKYIFELIVLTVQKLLMRLEIGP